MRTSSDRLHKVQDQIANNHKAEIDLIVKRLQKVGLNFFQMTCRMTLLIVFVFFKCKDESLAK